MQLLLTCGITSDLGPECFVAGAGAFCVSCCDGTLLFARARRLTHTEYAYALLPFQHGEGFVNQGTKVVPSFVFFLVIS